MSGNVYVIKFSRETETEAVRINEDGTKTSVAKVIRTWDNPLNVMRLDVELLNEKGNGFQKSLAGLTSEESAAWAAQRLEEGVPATPLVIDSFISSDKKRKVEVVEEVDGTYSVKGFDDTHQIDFYPNIKSLDDATSTLNELIDIIKEIDGTTLSSEFKQPVVRRDDVELSM